MPTVATSREITIHHHDHGHSRTAQALAFNHGAVVEARATRTGTEPAQVHIDSYGGRHADFSARYAAVIRLAAAEAAALDQAPLPATLPVSMEIVRAVAPRGRAVTVDATYGSRTFRVDIIQARYGDGSEMRASLHWQGVSRQAAEHPLSAQDAAAFASVLSAAAGIALALDHESGAR